MSWWQRFRVHSDARPHSPVCPGLTLELPGWHEEEPRDGMRFWRHADGDVLGLMPDNPFELPPLGDPRAAQQWCRAIAEGNEAGLIEVRVTESELGETLGFIYKRLKVPDYIFTGMLVVPDEQVRGVWTVVCGEHGMTGVREAVVTAQLMSAGQMTLDDYQQSWAQDPYDPAYAGVDRSSLRFRSDAEHYDAQFPEHPLTRVRQVLAALPTAIWLDADPAEGDEDAPEEA